MGCVLPGGGHFLVWPGGCWPPHHAAPCLPTLLVWRRSSSPARSDRPPRKTSRDPPSRCVGAGTRDLWCQGPARAVQGSAGCLRVPQHGCRWAGRCRSAQGRCPAWCPWASGPKKKSTRDVPRAGDVPVPASPLLTVLCLQAAPGPAPQLSPSEEAQRRLERIFTASVIRGGGWEFGDCAWPGARCWMGTLPRPRRVLSLGVCTAACGCQPRGPALGAAGCWVW